MSNHSRCTETQAILTGCWTSGQAYILAVITLLLGVAVGYLARGSATIDTTSQASNGSGLVSNLGSSGVSQQQSALPELTARVLEPLLQQLTARPDDPDLLIKIGDGYYDGKDYTRAIHYYRKALGFRPQDVDVRTDMGTAMWYSGDARGALNEYEQSLKFQPTHAQTLFNIGIVKWQGKKDGKGAIQSWEKLLASNPDYPDRPKVQQLIDQVRSETIAGP